MSQRKSCALCRNTKKDVSLQQIQATVCNSCADKCMRVSGDSSVLNITTTNDSDDIDEVFDSTSLEERSTTQLIGIIKNLIHDIKDKDKLINVINFISDDGKKLQSNSNEQTSDGNYKFILDRLDQMDKSIKSLSRQEKTSYADMAKKFTQQKEGSSAAPIKVAYDAKRTLLIENVSDKKIVESSMAIKKNISQHYPLTKFEVAYKTARGKIQIQLPSEDEANNMINTWKAEYLGGDTKVRKPSSQHIGVIRDCDPTTSDTEITEGVSKSYDNFTTARFKRTNGSNMPLVKVNFSSAADLEKAINNGVAIGQVICSVETYKPKPTPIRCYNCQKYNHVSKWCRSNTVCSRCGGDHKTEDCSDNKSYCANCKGEHYASSKDCPRYKEESSKINVNNG